MLKPGIQSRLFFTLLGTISLAVVAMVLAVNWSFQRGLEDYLREVELDRLDQVVSLLGQAYGEHGDWAFLRHNQRAWARIMEQGMGRPRGSPPALRPAPGSPSGPFPPPWHHPPFGGGFPPPRPEIGPLPPPPEAERGTEGAPREPAGAPPLTAPMAPPAPDPLDLRPRLRLFDADGELVFGPPGEVEAESRRPIRWQERTVGFLALRPGDFHTDELALAFQAGQRRTYLLISVLALLLSALVSLLLARRLLQPIRRIADAARALGAGRYATRIPVDRGDELGRLARDFNHLAAALERNEQVRRQWVADISHELRTPLAILRGEVEALLDGVRQASPERLQSLHGEVLGMGKLVDDLYELALSDLGALDYKREPLELAEIIEDAADTFRHRFTAKRLTLDNRVRGPLPFTGDGRRLRQLFINLLENSHRYTDPGGRLVIDVERRGGRYELLLQDTAPGVPGEALGQLFERLYRVDKSRSRALGGAGLGLAICRNIVTAHGGRIEAAHSSLGGLAVHIHLPVGEGGNR